MTNTGDGGDSSMVRRLNDALARVDEILTDGEDPIAAIGRILGIAEEIPDQRSVVLGYLFTRSDRFRSQFDRVKIPSSFNSRLKLIDAHLDFAIESGLPVADFYRSLDSLLDMPQFTQEEQRIVAIYWLVIDARLPYFQLPSTPAVSSEEWKAGVNQRSREFDLIKHIFARNIPEKSAEALQFRAIFDNPDNTDEDRMYLIAFMIFSADSRGYRRGRAENDQ